MYEKIVEKLNAATGVKLKRISLTAKLKARVTASAFVAEIAVVEHDR
jgi:hypothetical protein